VDKRKSRRFRQIERKESRQVQHLLHILTADFARRCWLAGVDTIAIGDLTGIRERIDYSDELNQRLHAWPFRKIVDMITYKAGLYGIQVVEVSEAYTSRACRIPLQVSTLSTRDTQSSRVLNVLIREISQGRGSILSYGTALWLSKDTYETPHPHKCS